MSENTLNVALRRMGVGQDVHTAHGFRASASTMLNDSNLFSVDAIERELAHQDEDAIRQA
jgi:integrase